MKPPTTDIKNFIVANTSWVFGTGLFIGREPPSPNICLTLFDTPGSGPLLFMNRDGNYDYANIQLRLRHTKYEDAMEELQTIVDLLHGRGNIKIGDTWYTKIEALDSPALLEWDDNNRAKVITNFEIQRRPET